jgi:hypothetical protein
MAQNDSTERWLPIPGWEDIYEVSDLGRIKRVAAHRTTRWPVGRITKGAATRQGYVSAVLTFRGRQWSTYAHRLVMAAFAGPCPPGQQVNHINGVKTDNRLENLEYVTPSENTRHAVRLGLKVTPVGDTHPALLFPDAVVADWRRRYAAGESGAAIAASAGAGRTTVYDALSGRHRAAVREAPPVPMRAQTVGDADSQMRYHDATVRAWRRLYAEGVRCAVIARAYDTTTQAVWQVVTGKRRGHVR